MSKTPLDSSLIKVSKFFERKVSLLSTSDVRYDGELYTVDPDEQSIALKHVNCLGTEGRRHGDQAIQASECTYEFIIFRAINIKELFLIENNKKKDLSKIILEPLRQHNANNVNYNNTYKNNNNYNQNNYNNYNNYNQNKMQNQKKRKKNDQPKRKVGYQGYINNHNNNNNNYDGYVVDSSQQVIPNESEYPALPQSNNKYNKYKQQQYYPAQSRQYNNNNYYYNNSNYGNDNYSNNNRIQYNNQVKQQNYNNYNSNNYGTNNYGDSNRVQYSNQYSNQGNQQYANQYRTTNNIRHYGNQNQHQQQQQYYKYNQQEMQQSNPYPNSPNKYPPQFYSNQARYQRYPRQVIRGYPRQQRIFSRNVPYRNNINMNRRNNRRRTHNNVRYSQSLKPGTGAYLDRTMRGNVEEKDNFANDFDFSQTNKNNILNMEDNKKDVDNQVRQDNHDETAANNGNDNNNTTYDTIHNANDAHVRNNNESKSDNKEDDANNHIPTNSNTVDDDTKDLKYNPVDFFDSLPTETRETKLRIDLQTQKQDDTKTFGNVASTYRSRHVSYQNKGNRNRNNNQRYNNNQQRYNSNQNNYNNNTWVKK